jgi:hypothetical protein
MHLDDLTDQAIFTDADNVEHVRVTHAFRDYKRSGYLFNRALAQFMSPLK